MPVAQVKPKFRGRPGRGFRGLSWFQWSFGEVKTEIAKVKRPLGGDRYRAGRVGVRGKRAGCGPPRARRNGRSDRARVRVAGGGRMRRRRESPMRFGNREPRSSGARRATTFRPSTEFLEDKLLMSLTPIDVNYVAGNGNIPNVTPAVPVPACSTAPRSPPRRDRTASPRAVPPPTRERVIPPRSSRKHRRQLRRSRNARRHTRRSPRATPRSATKDAHGGHRQGVSRARLEAIQRRECQLGQSLGRPTCRR